ncbi:MAG: ABC transporter substrate-binding protein [Dehalococcoidia bacterium]
MNSRLLVLIGSVIAIAIIGCGGGDDPTPTAPAGAGDPTATTTADTTATAEPTSSTDETPPASAPSGEIVIAVGEVPPLIQEPRRDISASGGIGKDLSVYETIVRAPHVSAPNMPPLDHTQYSPDDMGLAESWEVASDFSSITFQIRPDIPWHENGGDWGTVTAEDVAWTYNSAFAPDSVNNGSEEIGPEMKEGFEVLGPLEVRQNIADGGFDPTWAWLQGNASFNAIVIVNKTAFDELGPDEYSRTPIGTGKYRVLEWTGDQEVVLEAVEDHWTGIVPTVQSITLVHMPEEATRDVALRAEEVDIGQLSPQVVNSTVEAIGGRIQEIGISRPRGYNMTGNYWSTDCADCPGGVMDRPGFDEAIANPQQFPWIGNPEDPDNMEQARKVRWAMAMVVNQDAIVDQLLDGLGRKIFTWQNVLPDDPAHKDEWIIPYDPDVARQYMTDAGYPDGFNMDVWIPGDYPPGTVAAAEAVAEMWRSELQINATIDKSGYSTRRPQTVDKTLNVPFVHGINWIAEGGPASARYICPAGGHIVGITMEDEVCETGLANTAERDIQQRIENNNVVQDYLTEQMLFVPMFQESALLFAVGPRIAEWDPYNSQDVHPNRPESIRLR